MINFNHDYLNYYPYPSQRRVMLGKQCAVATSQPLASLAGMEMFSAGGNAVDAAVAMAIALTVVEPTSNGIGGDACALVWDGQVHGLNGSGKSPQALSSDQFQAHAPKSRLGWPTVTVPGAVSTWRTLWEQWGKLPFEQLFAPAIRHAREGFPVSPVTALAWQEAASRFLHLDAPEYQAFQEVFFPHQRAPKAGEIWRSPLHAETLSAIAQTGGESFYRGELAEKIANFASHTGGYLTEADLKDHKAQWVQPLSTTYHNLRVWELPPNFQGIATLIALNLLEGFDVGSLSYNSEQRYHWQVEAMKLAFADINRYLADPNWMKIDHEALLSEENTQQRRQLIGEQALSDIQPSFADHGTVYLTASDGELMVSLIQSNYEGFGSGILVPETGIALHNRGSCFSSQSGHPNAFAPGKRPFHTIMPGFLTQDGQPLGTFGVMGGQMQPQGHLQVVSNLADYEMNPQSALDAPRWRYLTDQRVVLETGIPSEVMISLSQRGHEVRVNPSKALFGKGQIILKHNGILVAGSEPRADGIALAM
ncbi:MAG: gamma-glutamyltransferase family protein [Halothece sp.]